jgi:hypothetical protein
MHKVATRLAVFNEVVQRYLREMYGYPVRNRTLDSMLPQTQAAYLNSLPGLVQTYSVKDDFNSYLESEEGRNVMGKYGLNRRDVFPAVGDLGEQAEAATMPGIYPHPVIKNKRNPDRFYRRVKKLEPILDRKDILSMLWRHELRHLSRYAWVPHEDYNTTKGSLNVERVNIKGLFDEYVDELSKTNDEYMKRKIAAKARWTLRHYLGTNAGYHNAIGRSYNPQRELDQIKSSLGTRLRPFDYSTLFNDLPQARKDRRLQAGRQSLVNLLDSVAKSRYAERYQKAA